MNNFNTDEWGKLVGKKVVSGTGNIYKVVSLARDPSVHLEDEKGNCLDFCIGSIMGQGWEKFEEPMKTLKDFDGHDGYGEPCKSKNMTDEDHINRGELKAEAIKRVKAYSKTIKDFYIKIDNVTGKVSKHNPGDDLDSIQKLNLGAIIELIELCNITDEDLMTQEEINAREHGEVGSN